MIKCVPIDIGNMMLNVSCFGTKTYAMDGDDVKQADIQTSGIDLEIVGSFIMESTKLEIIVTLVQGDRLIMDSKR